MDEAVAHCTRGLGHLGVGRATTTAASPTSCWPAPATCPTLETLAAAALLREHLPELKVRVVNVVDLMRLQPDTEHPHGLSDREFDALFTTDKPVIFAYHGYPWLIHRLTYRRTNHANIHVRGYKEEGTTTTPFDMVMLNDLDRFHLVMDVIDRVPGAGRARRARAPADGRRAARRPRLHPRARRGRPGDRRTGPGPDRGSLRRARPRRQRRVVAASSCACSTTTTRSLRRARPRRAGRRRLRRGALPRRSTAAGRRRRGRPPVVHGGATFTGPVRDRRATCARSCEALTDLAPLHQPKSLAALDAVTARAARRAGASPASTPRSTPTLPAGGGDLRAARPRGASAGAIRRYGFHGLSHAYASRRRAPSCSAGRRAGCGSSPATSAPARRCPRSPTAAASTPRWASRRSRGW